MAVSSSGLSDMELSSSFRSCICSSVRRSPLFCLTFRNNRKASFKEESAKYVPGGAAYIYSPFLSFPFMSFFSELSLFFLELLGLFSELFKEGFTLIKVSVSSSWRSQNLSTVIGFFSALAFTIAWYLLCIPAEVKTLSDWKSVLSNSDRSNKKFKTCFTLLLSMFRSSDTMNSKSSSIFK